jgi:RNA polymerase sigma factor (sigma-70 family)
MADSQEFDLIVKLHNPNTRNQAFSVLVNTHQERLYWHIRRMVVGHDDTDDILQNTFIKAFRALDNFRGESQLYTWLYRIATNETISFLKTKRLKMFVSFESAENHFAKHLEADSEMSGDSIQGKLQRAILKLPDKQRLVFNMKYYEEMKYEEMSEILGTSVGALKASYHHAVKKIERYVLEH